MSVTQAEEQRRAKPSSTGPSAPAGSHAGTGTAQDVGALLAQAAPGLPQGRADRFARWALRVNSPTDQQVHNLFSSSILLSATRCLLSYIILPVLAPWLGAVPLVGPAIGLPVGVVALVFDVRAMRRFFRAGHRWRWVAAALYLTVMAMVGYLVARDISHLI